MASSPPLAQGPLTWRVLNYALRAPSLGASDEGRLFASYGLSVSRPFSLPVRSPLLEAETLPFRQGNLAETLGATHTRALQIYRSGELVLDWRKEGDAPERTGRLYSITKSILSLVLGIAAQEGFFPRPETLLGEVLGGLKDEKTGLLSLRQLLTMDSGLDFDEGFRFWNHQVRTYLHPDSRRAALSARVTDPVSSYFRYNDYHSLLLGLVLEEGLKKAGWRSESGVTNLVAAYFLEKLFWPLGLQNRGAFVVDSGRKGFPKTESGLCLSATDTAKIGQLVLQGGVWNGRQLVPAAWLEQSLTPVWKTPSAFSHYAGLAWGPWLSTGRGFYASHWWGITQNGSPPAIFAMGIHGQILLISPRHQAVVVRLADRWALKDWWPEVLLDLLDSLV